MKLIRDNVPAREGDVIEVLTDIAKVRFFLRVKMYEEFAEVERSGCKDHEEYADVLEALIALAEAHGINWMDIIEAKAAKRERLGGFSKARLLTNPRCD